MLKQAAERVSCMSSRGSVLSRIFVQEWELTERDRVRVGDTTIEYEVHRSKRRKKTLQITVADRVVRVAVPWITKTREVREFVREQAPWIISSLADLAPPQGRQTGPERDSIRVGDTTIEYEVRRSRRRKKTVLVTVERGVVRVVVPSVAKSDAIRRAVRKRAAWIISRLSQAPPKRNQTGPERDSIRVGDTTIEYEVLRSKRRKKTVQIRVESGVVRVVVPSVAKPGAVRRAVRERAAWIISRLSQAPPEGVQKRFVNGESLPYLGEDVRIAVRFADVRSPEIRLRRRTLPGRGASESQGAETPRGDAQRLRGVVPGARRCAGLRVRRQVVDQTRSWREIAGTHPQPATTMGKLRLRRHAKDKLAHHHAGTRAHRVHCGPRTGPS